MFSHDVYFPVARCYYINCSAGQISISHSELQRFHDIYQISLAIVENKGPILGLFVLIWTIFSHRLISTVQWRGKPFTYFTIDYLQKKNKNKKSQNKNKKRKEPPQKPFSFEISINVLLVINTPWAWNFSKELKIVTFWCKIIVLQWK